MEMDEAPMRLRGKPSWLLGRVATLSHRSIGETMAALGGHAYQFAILAALDEFGPASQVRIGQRCAIDQSDMHTMLNELSKQGHVERTPDASDRRRNLITLTAAGHQRLEALDAALTVAQDNILDDLTSTERDRLTALLTRILT